MSDKVIVKNLRLHAHHGVYAEENTLGQKFEIDITCVLDTRPFAEADNYQIAVCYGSLCDLAEEVSGSGPFALIEKFGHEICLAILKRYKEVESATVAIRKPSAPVSQMVDYLGVEITRSQADLSS